MRRGNDFTISLFLCLCHQEGHEAIDYKRCSLLHMSTESKGSFSIGINRNITCFVVFIYQCTIFHFQIGAPENMELSFEIFTN